MSNQSSPFESLYQEELYYIPSRVIIIVNKEWEALTDEDKTLLSKILGSVKLTLAVVQIITLKQFSVEELSAYTPQRIISFGATLKSSAQLYEHIYMNEVSVILAHSLDKLDDAKKKSLWLALRKMFGI